MIQESNTWQLDKKFPVIIILSLIAQTISFIVVGSTWKAETEARLLSLERSTLQSESQETRIIILEQKFGFIQDTLLRIEKKLEKVKP